MAENQTANIFDVHNAEKAGVGTKLTWKETLMTPATSRTGLIGLTRKEQGHVEAHPKNPEGNVFGH